MDPGLDAYNALSVIDSLVSLARDYNRTVVFTIHQPRSNIVSLFDQLIVLAQGKLIYSGEADKVTDYLAQVGHPCPLGFNVADFLSTSSIDGLAMTLSLMLCVLSSVDLTMQAGMEPRSLDSPPSEEAQPVSQDDINIRDEERAFTRRDRPSSISLRSTYQENAQAEETELRTRPSSIYSSTAYIRRQTARLLDAFKPSAPKPGGIVPHKLQELINSYKDSEIHQQLVAEIDDAAASSEAQANGNGTTELPDVAVESNITRGRKRASYGTQFRILSGRAFKNLYRDPALLFAHYIASIGVARTYCTHSYSDVEFLLMRDWQSFADSSSRTSPMISLASRTGWACSSSHSRSLASRVSRA